MTTPLYQTRSKLTLGDPDRGFAYFFTRSGDLTTYQGPGVYKLTPTTGPEIPVNRVPWPKETANNPGNPLGNPFTHHEDWWDACYHGGLIAPDGLKAGTYRADLGRGPEAALVVQDKVVRHPALVYPNFSRAVVQGILEQHNDVTFAPGHYHYDQPLVVRQNQTRLTLYGAYFTPPETGYAGWRQVFRADLSVGELSVYGGTFLGNPQVTGNVAFTSLTTSPGLVVAHAQFRFLNFAVGFTEAYVRHCEFVGCGCVNAPGGLYLKNRFVGPWANDAFTFGTQSGCVALVDNLFEAVGRGVAINTVSGPVSGVLLLGTSFNNINNCPGGAELILSEGTNPLTDLVVLHTRHYGCNGPVLSLGNSDTVANRVTILDTMGDGSGVWLGGVLDDVVISNFEFRNGAGVYVGPNVTNYKIDQGRCYAFAPSRYNLSFPAPGPLTQDRASAVVIDPLARGTIDVISTNLSPAT